MGTLPPQERRERAEYGKRACMLQLTKRAVTARNNVYGN
jgi:hypothetical protein